MLKFKTVRSTFAYLSSNLLNEVGLSLFRYFEVGLRVCDIVVKKFTFAISSPDEFLLKQGVALTGRNRTGPPCSVGHSTAARARRPAHLPAGSVTDDDRRQRAKQYWPIWRASNNSAMEPRSLCRVD